jgi:hypothetical protein
MKLDIEYYLALPLRHLALWVGVPYDGEFRNGHAAHIFAGWSLTLTLSLITPYLAILSFLYPIYREYGDAKGWAWNRKSWADLLTFEVGNIIGLIIGVIII